MNIFTPRYGAILVAAIAAIVYLNTLSNGFVSDDQHLIFRHPFVQHVRDWPRIFTSGHYEGSGGYRPLTTLSFAINHFVGRANPIGYHAVNIALHACNTALILLLLTRILAARLGAFIGALIFALHPVHTEAVAWISGRAELLVAFFFLTAWLFHLRGRHVTSIWSSPRILSAVALLAALLSKENALIFPVVVIAADILISRWQSHWDALTGFKPWQRAVRLYLPSLITIAVYFVGRGLLYRRSIWRAAAKIQFVDNPLAHVTAVTRLLTAIKVQAEYLWLLVWPRHLCADYSYNSVPLVTHLNEPTVVIALSILILLCVIAGYSFVRGGRLWFGIFFYFVAILPVANIVTVIGTIKAERFLYLPSFALSFVAALGAIRLARANRFRLPEFRWIRIGTVSAFVVLLFVGSAATWKRNRVWRNERTLWESVVAVAPNNSKAQLEVGREALTSRDLPRAIGAFRRALEIDPDAEDATINLSAALIQDRQSAEASRVLEQALSRHGERSALHLNLGLAHLASGRVASGVSELRRACELDPENTVARFNLALALSTTGDPQSAVAEYRRALEIDPNYAEAWNGLGAALLKLHRNDEARNALQRALSLRPGYSEAIYNMTLLDSPR